MIKWHQARFILSIFRGVLSSFQAIDHQPLLLLRVPAHDYLDTLHRSLSTSLLSSAPADGSTPCDDGHSYCKAWVDRGSQGGHATFPHSPSRPAALQLLLSWLNEGAPQPQENILLLLKQMKLYSQQSRDKTKRSRIWLHRDPNRSKDEQEDESSVPPYISDVGLAVQDLAAAVRHLTSLKK
jgi:hypothetical protein